MYEDFKERVNRLLRRVNGVTASFSKDEEHGRFIADCSDGTQIIMRENGLSATVKWGSGHMSMARI